MGKNQTGKTNKDVFHRINYLFQAALSVLSQNPNNLGLVRYYVQTLKSVAGKSALRLDPSIKRQICKKCAMILVPGITTRIRIKAKKSPVILVTCTECGFQKKYIHSEKHKLWSENPAAWFDSIPKHLNITNGECSSTSNQKHSKDKSSQLPTSAAHNVFKPQKQGPPVYAPHTKQRKDTHFHKKGK